MRTAISATLVVLLGLSGGVSRADLPLQAFSADIIRRNAGGTVTAPPAKLHVRDFKTRIDTPDVAGGFFLTDAAAGTAFFVRSGRRVFMDAKQSTPLTRIFIRVDPRDPCPQWQAAALAAGTANADDRLCEAIRAAAVVDPILRFPIKWQSPDGGTIVLENIRREAQPADLFVVPAGYRKFDPQDLVERMKHSDVWAEPAPTER